MELSFTFSEVFEIEVKSLCEMYFVQIDGCDDEDEEYEENGTDDGADDEALDNHGIIDDFSRVTEMRLVPTDASSCILHLFDSWFFGGC